MSTAFDQSRAAELLALEKAAELLTTAATLEDLTAQSKKAHECLVAAIGDNLISNKEYRQWREKLESLEADRLSTM